ncbi:MAG: NAD-dependent protein deacetylase [Nocardioidaceae bacterium]
MTRTRPPATTVVSRSTASEVLDEAVELMAGRRIVALTGAGMSTDSGIPDYRGPGASPRRPMTYGTFASGPAAQQRYWARAYAGWAFMASARPNAGHAALARLEALGVVRGLITQNVDGLHTRAGHRRLVDLHGRLGEVVCMSCRQVTTRTRLQSRLAAANPHLPASPVEMAPDGDAVLSDVESFRLVGCERCNGPLKPHVVFFGENVPRERVDRCAAMVEDADALLVLGSSLSVLSGLRFVRQAVRAEQPVVIVNRGWTRGDDLSTLKLDAGCAQTLGALLARWPGR